MQAILRIKFSGRSRRKVQCRHKWDNWFRSNNVSVRNFSACRCPPVTKKKRRGTWDTPFISMNFNLPSIRGEGKGSIAKGVYSVNGHKKKRTNSHRMTPQISTSVTKKTGLFCKIHLRKPRSPANTAQTVTKKTTLRSQKKRTNVIIGHKFWRKCI